MYLVINEALNNIKEEYIRNSSESEHLYFGPLSRINLFVGANNSGKSRLLRTLLKNKDFVLSSTPFLQSLKENLIEEKENLSKLTGGPSVFIKRNGFSSFSYADSLSIHTQEYIKSTTLNNSSTIKPESIINELALIIDRLYSYSIDPKFTGFLNGIIGKYELFVDCLKRLNLPIYRQFFDLQESTSNTNDHKKIMEITVRITKYLKEIENAKIVNLQPKKFYVPILRSAVSIFFKGEDGLPQKIDQDVYEYTTKLHYGLQEDVEIETGRNLYKKIRRIRNDIKQKRDEFEKFEHFLSESFFDNKKVDIVARDTEDPNEAHINIFIDEADRDIHHLGDGIQSIITIMFMIFTASKGAWIFIEEPEITLHPGFQRILLDQLLQNKDFEEKELRFFISTHSNHLLDLSLESKNNISIFAFERKESEGSTYNSFKNVKNNDVDILNILGVKNSSVFLANCSIWVEGHTDAKYISSYLNAYLEENELPPFKEDIEFSFYIYGGSNISHYLFSAESESEDLLGQEKIKAQFLSNRIFLIADQDEGKEDKHLNILQQENKNFKYYKLPVREIENLLSVKQLKLFLPEIARAIKKETLETADLHEKDYRKKYLGTYLSQELGAKNIPKGFVDKSGTLKTYYKNKLSEKIQENIRWNEMSLSAKKLATEVYSFISEHNC